MQTLLLIVKPGSSRDEIIKGPDGGLIVRIKARPVKGAANKYLVEFLAKVFGLRKSAVILEKGFTGSHKRVSLDIDKASFEVALMKIKEAEK